MIFKQFTTAYTGCNTRSLLLLHPKVHDFQAIHNAGVTLTLDDFVVTTSKGTWFSSNSQLCFALYGIFSVVTTSKGTWFSSNSQHDCVFRVREIGCYYIQRYMIFKQFTTLVQYLVLVCVLLLHPKVHDFQAIHNRVQVVWNNTAVVTTSKGTWFSSNSQPARVISPLDTVVTTSKGTWFSSNSQHTQECNEEMQRCYYIQRYMIFKQFTTSAWNSPLKPVLLLHPKVHDFQAIHNISCVSICS